MVRQERDEGQANEDKNRQRRSGASEQDNCRCKETAGMSTRELLKLMISDLSFWKKAKK